MNDIENDERLEKLFDEIREAVSYFKSDERNTSIRENVIFRAIADKLLTDFERAEYYGLPDTCRMREGVKIISPENLICGDYVYISENAIIDASGGLEIGNHTTIGVNACIWTHSTVYSTLSLSQFSPAPYNSRKRSIIGNGVFIGANSVIMPGTSIADLTVIQPLSLVDFIISETNSIVGGNPARIVGHISNEKIKSKTQEGFK